MSHATQSEAYTKPLPELTPDNEPFWTGCAEGELRMQQCGQCQYVRYPISFVCPRCLAKESTWITLNGTGEVYSSIVFHQVYNKEFADDVPYQVVLVQLDEGPRMFSNVVQDEGHPIGVGDRVEVVFDQVTGEISIPKFRPASST